MDGGYDDGYRACPCFWGDKPGSLVTRVLAEYDCAGKRVLDLGCGEGKNAAAFARAGAFVTAVDCSELAVSNGRRSFRELGISWIVGDLAEFSYAPRHYNIVVMYGVTHCLPSKDAIQSLIHQTISSTAPGGLHVLAAFNNRDHDMERAHPNFYPTLLHHVEYTEIYAGQQIIDQTDTILYETHPHNGIAHHHSLTRMLVKIR